MSSSLILSALTISILSTFFDIALNTSLFGANPWDDPNQDYDFRPKKGSYLIDSGVIIPGINDGREENVLLETEKPGVPVNPRSDTENLTILNHPPLYPGQNRKFVGDAPDIGAYEYGDSVYWIPGYRYPHPSVPIPKNNAVNVPMDYSLAWNYPYKKDYSATTATVSLSGPGVNPVSYTHLTLPTKRIV